MSDFERELENLLNRHSKENGSDTPDFILAKYLLNCLRALDEAIEERGKWYGHHDRAGVSEYTGTKGRWSSEHE